jgi:hypothetical protein
MLRAREVVESRSWSTSQGPTSEHWWSDVLTDPRARRRRVAFIVAVGQDGRTTLPQIRETDTGALAPSNLILTRPVMGLKLVPLAAIPNS